MKKCILCSGIDLGIEIMDNEGKDCYFYRCKDCGAEYVDYELMMRNKEIMEGLVA